MLADVSDSKDSSERRDSLSEFGVAMATLPFNAENVRSKLDEVRRVGGEELVVEACCTAAAFEGMTRVVDATIRFKDKKSTMVMKIVVRLINNIAFFIITLWTSILWRK